MVGCMAQSPCYPEFEHVNHYWDRQRNKLVAKILPGEFYMTEEDTLIATTLGSCVSACVWDQRKQMGGMNHFMLPITKKDADSVNWGNVQKVSTATRYGNFAMEYLINSILKYGGCRQDLKIKIFGGAKVLSYMTDVGQRNINFVLQYLKDERFDITTQDLGGEYPRKVLFDPKTGQAFVKKLKVLNNNTIIEREQNYQNSIGNEPLDGDVELF